MSANDVTAVIPNYNGGDFIGGCLDALLSQTRRVEVLVVDDSSTDGSADLIEQTYPNVAVLRRSANGGFAAAANEGVRAADTPLVAVINSDARLSATWFETVLAHCHDDRYWAWGGVLLEPGSGRIDSAGDCYTASGRAYRGLRGSEPGLLPKRPYDVFAVPGAAAAFCRDRFLELGGYDERHFMYLEDIDLACRAHQRGWSSLVDPRATGEHDTARSGDRVRAFYLIGRNGTWCWIRNAPRLNTPGFLADTVRQYRSLRAFGAHEAAAFRRGRLAGLATARAAFGDRRTRATSSSRERMARAIQLVPVAAATV